MTPHELAGKLLVGIGSVTLSTPERDWLAYYRPAGVVLFGRNIADAEQLHRLCSEVHSLLGPAAEIVADHEGGPISVLAAALGRPPAPWTLGQIDDCELTRVVHRATGQRLSGVGIDRLLGPCCDVLVERRNPVIGARSFGGRTDLVTRHVTAAVSGLTEARIRCCLKHWPGHGGSRVDSHDDAVVTVTAEVTEPFCGGWQAGADALMIGHLPWSGRDAGDAVADESSVAGSSLQDPATLDPAALTAARSGAPAGTLLFADDITMGGLRAAMGRRGISAADGCEHGLVDPAALPAAWLTALLHAGCDRLLIRGIPWGVCPLGGRDTADHSAAPAERQEFAVADQPQPYRRARERALATSWVWEPTEALLWLDATCGDRWGSAAGLEPLLAGRFPQLTRLVTATSAGTAANCRPEPDVPPLAAATHSWSNLLVTSHRSLDRQQLTEALSEASCAPQGACLVMGHPSLIDDLTEQLGPRWRIAAVYDTAPADLAPTLAVRQ